MWAAFVSIVSHPRATRIKKKCEVSHGYADSHWRHIGQIHRWWKTIRGTRVRKPHISLSLTGPTSPLRRDERRESTSTTRLFCLFTFRITPCSSWTVFQCVLLCFLSNRISMRVVSRPCLANTCTHSRTHTPIQLSPCARGPLCPSPLL